MPTYTEYKHLEKPLSTEKYNVGVFNKNNDIIDAEFHKLELKNADQDTILASKEDLNQHTGNQENPHSVSKAQIGLDNVDNTADLDKPVSTAQRAAINDIYIQTNSYVDIKITSLIDGVSEKYNTLKKIADILENDFILMVEEELLFVNNVSTILNEKITNHSLAFVFFTNDTIDTAKNADISVETFEGGIRLIAKNTPTGIIKATINIRVV